MASDRLSTTQLRLRPDTPSPPIRRSGITILCGDARSVVDIVLLHGLNGSPEKTWAHPSTGFFWPWDLRKRIPDARVLLFGYDADITPQFGTNLIRIKGLAESLLGNLVNKRQEDYETNRPLIFVGHSLGGLIIKKALVLASQAVNTEADDAHLIYNSTKGLMFFGTPHAGSATNNTKRVWVLQKIAKAAFTEVPPRLEAALEMHSDELADLADDFRKTSLWIRRGVIIYTYFETRTTAKLGEVVVDELSARVGYDKETAGPIQADHENIVKFADEDDGDYENVWNKMKILKRKATQTGSITQIGRPASRTRTAGRLQGPATFYMPMKMPFMRNKYFTGRGDILSRMVTKLQPGRLPNECELKTLVLHGLGGVGKTQIAVQYSYLHESDYDSIWWIDMTDKGRMETSIFNNMKTLVDHRCSELRMQSINVQYTQVALDLGIPAKAFTDEGDKSIREVSGSMTIIKDAFKKWLSLRDNRRWLLILDNYDNPEGLDIAEVLPMSASGSVIMTTRTRDLESYQTAVEVGEMDDETGIDLLLKMTGPTSETTTDERKHARAIVKRLGGLPLALDQAAAYVLGLQLPLSGFLPRFEKEFKSILKRKPLKTLWKQRAEASFTTWEISVDFLRNSCKDAIILLDISAFLDNGVIQEDIFRSDIAYLNKKFGLASIDDGILHLFRYSLAKRNMDAKAFWIHPLVHTWARERLDEERIKGISEAATHLLAQSLFWDKEDERKVLNWTRETQLMPHINICVKTAEVMLSRGSWTDVGLEAVYTLARICFWHGRYSESKTLMQTDRKSVV